MEHARRFTGFSMETIDFLFELLVNNERLWFQRHKEEYKRLVETPLKDLAHDVFWRMAHRYPEREFVCKVYPIYKDPRTYRGMEPYRESVGFAFHVPTFPRQDAPAFFFELNRNYWRFGLSLRRARGATMANLRKKVETDPQPLVDLHYNLRRRPEFSLRGDRYAAIRPSPVGMLFRWYNFRGLEISHIQDMYYSELFERNLVEKLTFGYTFLMDYHDYLLPLTAAGANRLGEVPHKPREMRTVPDFTPRPAPTVVYPLPETVTLAELLDPQRRKEALAKLEARMAYNGPTLVPTPAEREKEGAGEKPKDGEAPE